MKKLIILLFLVSLCGCGVATVDKLKESPGNKLSFDTDQGYEAAYRKAVKYARQNEAALIGGPRLEAKCDLYNDIKKGEISIVLHNIFGSPQVFVSADIESIGQNKSSVVIYSALSHDVRPQQMKEAILAE